jgi:hypothetical protein
MSETDKIISKESWWLVPGDYPDLHWSRLQVYDDNTAEVLQPDGRRYKFDNEEEARWFLLEDDYSSFENLDAEDEEELGMPISSIEIPFGDNDDEIIKKMYVKRTL